MSFFYTKTKKQAKIKKEAGGPPSSIHKARQSAATLERLGCKACPLNSSEPKVEVSIPKKTDIYFLGEAPGEREAQEGVPFVGKSGQLLRSMIPDEYKKYCAFGNVLLHRPPDNRDPTWAEIACCKGYATKGITKASPRLIVGLGKHALQWVVGSADMVGLRGRFFAVEIGGHPCWFLPTYHPSFILRQAQNQNKPLHSRMGLCFRMDLEKAFNFLEDLDPPEIISSEEAKKDIDIFNGHVGNFEELLKHFRLATKAKEKAIDLETYPLRPYSPNSIILTSAISYFWKKKQYTFAYAIDHPKSGWSKGQRDIILKEQNKLISDKSTTKIAHHLSFELEWLINYHGLDFLDHDSWVDTMKQAHILDERKGPGRDDDNKSAKYQSLDFLIKQHFGLAVKSLFKLDKKDMRKTDLDECLLYNGLDSKVTLPLYERQKKLIKSESLDNIYQFSIPRQTTVAIMQSTGVPVDQKVLKKFKKKLDKEIEDVESKINNLKVVKHYIKDKGNFNPHSQPDVLSVFRDYLKRDEIKILKEHTKSKDDFRESVDKNVLETIDHPLAKFIVNVRNRQKLKSTYVTANTLGIGKAIHPDGKLHTSYNTTFVTTDRLSSSDPNLQNWDKRENPWVREQVRKDGHVVLSVDYGQLEWNTACILSKDKKMVEATWNGYDVHMHWAKRMGGLWPELVGGKKYLKDEKIMKIARSRIKNKWVFPAIFGAKEESIAGYLGMPLDIASEGFEEFWDEFEGLKKWQDNLMLSYYKKGYVTNQIGFRRRYPMTRNEAINDPIQNLAAEIVLDAMDRMSKLALDTEMYLHPVLNIHDDISYFLPDNDKIIEESIEIIYREMLRLPYDFINVPFSVEVSIGPDWYHLEDLGRFWSHLDL